MAEHPPIPTNIDLNAYATEAKASVVALANDALAGGAITLARHLAIVADPGAHVVPQIGFADDLPKGPRVLLSVKVSPALLSEFGLPERLT